MTNNQPISDREQSLYVLVREMREASEDYLEAKCVLQSEISKSVTANAFAQQSIDRQLRYRIRQLWNMAAALVGDDDERIDEHGLTAKQRRG